MTVRRNTISCDGYGCRTEETFVGDLSSEGVEDRYHILGWTYSESDGQKFHYCPSHP